MDKVIVQRIALLAIFLVSGAFLWTGMFAVFAYLWWFLLIAGVASFIRTFDIPLSFFT